LTAAIEHGPGMHGTVLGVVVMALVAIAVAGGLVYYMKRRRRSVGDRASDRSSEPSDRSREP
jgi:hypothetical protein